MLATQPKNQKIKDKAAEFTYIGILLYHNIIYYILITCIDNIIYYIIP